jgi:hypothetical protein
MTPLRVSAGLKGRASTAGPSPGPHPGLEQGQPPLRSGSGTPLTRFSCHSDHSRAQSKSQRRFAPTSLIDYRENGDRFQENPQHLRRGGQKALCDPIGAECFSPFRRHTRRGEYRVWVPMKG